MTTSTSINCIMCRKMKPPSEEHIFPDAIGGTLKINNVCEKCNNDLGNTADCHLTDHPLINLKRFVLSIPNRDNKIPQAIKAKYGELVLRSNHEIKFLLANENGNIKTRVKTRVYKKEIKFGKVHGEFYHSVGNEEDVDSMYNAYNKKNKRKKANYISKNKFKMNTKTITVPTNHIEFVPKKEAFESTSFIKGLLKIAYELGCVWLGDSYADDPIAIQHRKVFISGVNKVDMNKVNGYFYPLHEVESMFEVGYDGSFHLGVLHQLDNKVYCILRVFDCFEAMILLTNHSVNYEPQNHFVSINSITGKFEEGIYKI